MIILGLVFIFQFGISCSCLAINLSKQVRRCPFKYSLPPAPQPLDSLLSVWPQRSYLEPLLAELSASFGVSGRPTARTIQKWIVTVSAPLLLKDVNSLCLKRETEALELGSKCRGLFA